MYSDEEILDRFNESVTNHTPTPANIEKIEAFREGIKNLAKFIVGTAPSSRERSLALTHLEEVTMWTVKAIVLPSNN